MGNSICIVFQMTTTVLALCLPRSKAFTLALWIYCCSVFPISLRYEGPNVSSLKLFLVNVLVSTSAVAPKFRPAIVTKTFVLFGAFLLSVNILWTMTEPIDIQDWKFIVYIFSTVILAIYPLCYTSIAMREESGELLLGMSPTFGTTKHGILFLPFYRPTMLLAYCIWNIIFVIFWKGNISGLFHNVMAIIIAVIFASIEGMRMVDSVLFWPVSRALTLSCWMTTSGLLEFDLTPLDCKRRFLDVESDGTMVDILVTILLVLTIIGAVDFSLCYIRVAKKRKVRRD